MSRFFLEAVRALPEAYVDDLTQIGEHGDGAPFAVATHPALPAIEYHGDQWTEIPVVPMIVGVDERVQL